MPVTADPNPDHPADPAHASADADDVLTRAELSEAVARGDAEALLATLTGVASDDLAHALERLDDDEHAQLLTLLDAGEAAGLLELMPESRQIDTLESMNAPAAAAVLRELPPDEQADLLSEVDNAEDIYAQLAPGEAAGLRTLASYADESAGGLMDNRFLSFGEEQTVAGVVAGLAEVAEREQGRSGSDGGDVQYVYVNDADGRLTGVLRLRDLLLSRRALPVTTVMIPAPQAVHVDDGLTRLNSFFDEHHFLAAPVLDDAGLMLGTVRAAAVRRAFAERAGDDYSKAAGIVGEELRSMPLRTRCGRRLAWLSLNIVLNIGAASIIALNQDTLEAVIALAVFLPIISDMSGCSGNQAVAVSMRELSLNVARPADWLRVWGKEAMVGVVNGLALGLLVGGLAYLWKGNVYLGAVVGVALMVNTLVAVSIGGTIPLVLKGMKLDPALASGPILTTVTDMCGFFLVLTMASLVLAQLA